MTARLFLGCQRGDLSPLTDAITWVGDALTDAPPVLPAGRATHALAVVVFDDTGFTVRIDAGVPRCTMFPFTLDAVDRRRCALWEVRLPESQIHAGIATAWLQPGRPYDLAELAAQLAPVIASAPIFEHLPIKRRFELLATLPWLPGADICTGMVLEILAACGGPAAALAHRVGAENKHPETLIRAFALAHAPWLHEVITSTQSPAASPRQGD